MPMKPLKKFVLILFAIVFVGAIGVNSGCSSGSSSGTDNPNQDSDQDGINNGNDPDADGDGIPNNGDQDNPPPPIADSGKACTTTKIYWPNDEIVAGDNADLRWELLPKGCGLSSTQNKAVKAIGSSGNVSVASVAKYPGQLITSIRVPCDPQFGSAKRPVRYDFTELGRMLGDSQGGYQATISHPGSSKGCSGGDGNSGGGDGSNPTQCSDFSGTSGGTYPNCTCSNSNYVFDGGACVPQNSGGGNECPTENGAGGTYPSCSCANGYNYNASTNTCEEPGVCTSAVVNWPNELYPAKIPTKMAITWILKPRGCVVDAPGPPYGDTIVRGSADLVGVSGYFSYSNGQYASVEQALFAIPCYGSGIVPPEETYQYDLEILELAELLGDTNTAPYKKTYFQNPTCR